MAHWNGIVKMPRAMKQPASKEQTMTEPTDAELDELRQANSGKLNFVTFSEFRTIARAVLEKWGTPQPVDTQAGNPTAGNPNARVA